MANPTETPPRRSRAQCIFLGTTGLYFAALGVIWILLETAVDRWWPATVLAYCPRWLLGIPFALLLPAAWFVYRRMTWLIAAAFALFVGPIMGFCIPWPSWPQGTNDRFTLRVLTCNVHRLRLAAGPLRELIEATKPDLVALQDSSSRNELELFGDGGWHVQREGELFIASRFPIAAAEVLFNTNSSQEGSACVFELDTPIGKVPAINVHLASPHFALEELLGGKRAGVEFLEANTKLRAIQSARVGAAARRDPQRALVLGDFNTPPESAIYREHWSDVTNAFSSAGWGWGNTYRTRRLRIRIDHVLLGSGWSCRRCWLGPQVGTPHRPVLAELEWQQQY